MLEERAITRRTGKWTPALKRRFCEAIAAGASPTKAAGALDLSRQSAYYQRGIDAEFAAAWEEALEQAADLYEDALDKLALKSGNVGAVIFQLKNRRPDRWRDRHEMNVNRHSLNLNIVVTDGQADGIMGRLARRWAAGQGLIDPDGGTPSLPAGTRPHAEDSEPMAE